MTREEQINAVAVSKGVELKNNLIKESVSEGIARMYSNIAVSYFEKGAKYADEHPDIEAIKAIEDHAYFAGSEAMREKMTNKACEWFYVQFNYGDMECGNIMEFIERFKKAMNL